jgi:hypothetical protein
MLTLGEGSGLSENPIAADDFLIAWSEPETPPILAADELPGSAPRTVTLLPAAPQPTASTLARWSIDEEQARLLFEARFSQVPAARFRHELDLPPALKVQRVRLTAAGAEVPTRWRQRPDGSLVVTLLAAPPPEQLLEVEAAVVRARNRPRLPLPNIDVQEAQRLPPKSASIVVRRSEYSFRARRAGISRWSRGWDKMRQAWAGWLPRCSVPARRSGRSRWSP